MNFKLDCHNVVTYLQVNIIIIHQNVLTHALCCTHVYPVFQRLSKFFSLSLNFQYLKTK